MRLSLAAAKPIAGRLVLAALLASSLVLSPLAMVAAAASDLAQEQPPDTEDPVEEEDPVGEEREDGVGEEDDAGTGPGEEEEGPPWTYQMARLSLAALAGLGLAVGAAYYRFVILRRRGYV